MAKTTALLLLKEIETPDELQSLTAKELVDYESHLNAALSATPDLTISHLLHVLQNDLGFATKRHILRDWLENRRLHAGLMSVTCAAIPERFWMPILTADPNISAAGFAQRLADDLRLWTRQRNLATWLSRKSREVVKMSEARESHRSHWAEAIDAQFSVCSVHRYPRRIPVTAPIRVFQLWTSLLSWAVCEECGRRDTSLWKNPCVSDLDWKLTIPELSGMTCGHHAFWYQSPLLETGSL